MYDKLNYNIENYEFDDIESMYAWENAISEASSEILQSFEKDDWKKLYEELPKKSTIWKKRFYDCLPDIAEDENEIKALLLLTETDDAELFALSLAKLENYDFSDVENIDKLYEKAEAFLPKIEDEYQKYIINSFLEKKTKSR